MHRISTILAAILFLLGGVSVASAQLSGTYTINNDPNASPTPDYTDVGAAISALMSQGVSAATTFEIYDDGGPYTSAGSWYIQSFSNPTSAMVTFQPAPGESPILQGSGAPNPFSGNPGVLSLNNAFNVTIQNLEIRDSSGFGLYIYNCSNINFIGNRIHNVSGGPGIFGYGNGGTINNIVIANNVIWDCAGGTSSTRGWAVLGFRRAGSTVSVEYNTVIQTSRYSAGSAGVIANNGTTDRFGSLQNNIFISHVSGTPMFQTDTSTNGANVADGNIWYRVTGQTGPFAAANWPTFAQWQSAGFDANGTDTDPMLTATAMDPIDIEPMSTSPIFGTGVATATTVTTDYQGDTRANPPTPGADELPTPVVTGVSPNPVDWYGTLTITGTGLRGATVEIGTVAQTVVSSRDDELVLTVDGATPVGSQTVAVTNSTVTDSSQSVTVNAVPPMPTSVSPSTAGWGDMITLSGTAMAGISGATIGGNTAVIVSTSATDCVLMIPDGTTVGPQVIEVSSPGGSDNSQMVDVTTNAPTLAAGPPSASPWFGTAIIMGSLLATATDATVDGIASSIVTASTGMVEITIPVTETTGMKEVVITTEGGSDSIMIEITGAPAVLTDTLPVEFVVKGSELTINGNALQNAVSVTINGEAVTDFLENTSTVIRLAVPQTVQAGMDVELTVETAFGTSNALAVTVTNPLAPGENCGVTANGGYLWIGLVLMLLGLPVVRRRIAA